MKRVGIVALLHESNTFIHEPTTIEHFRSNLIAEGSKVIDAFRGSMHEVGGFIDQLAECNDIELVGLFGARAMPYGTIDRDCWAELMRCLEQNVREAGPLDGVLVAPHGATVAEDALDADGDWLERLRSWLGPDIPMIGTLDLHANVSQRMVQACQALFGYRTNPHLDQFQCGQAAAKLMIRTLRGQATPSMALVHLPLCVNIERQATSEPQGVKLWQQAERIANDMPGIVSVSCLYGFPYSDVPEMGASVIAVSDSTPATAEQAAGDMADFWWSIRDEFAGQMISVEEAIRMANSIRAKHPDKPVGLLEMGDNVGGGSPGDGTWMVHGWLQLGIGNLLVVIADAEVVLQANVAGVGGVIETSIGGKADPKRHGPPWSDQFEVLSLSDGKFSESQVRHGGYNRFDQGPTAVLRGQLGVTVIATTLRMAPLSLQQVLSQHVRPEDFAAIVLKGVHAPTAAYSPLCSQLLRVNTMGVTTADLKQLDFVHRRRPMEPFERMERWR